MLISSKKGDGKDKTRPQSQPHFLVRFAILFYNIWYNNLVKKSTHLWVLSALYDGNKGKDCMHIIVVMDKTHELRRTAGMVYKAAPNAVISKFSSSQDALSHAHDNPVDLAFLKVDMPKLDGVFLARHLRKTNPYMNLIFIDTGESTNADLLDIWELSASGLLSIPFSQDEIDDQLKTLRRMLGGRVLPTIQ